MKNADYWQMRFKELEEAQHNKGVRAVANIDRIYKRAEKDIERKIALWYQRLADNNDVTLADAKKMLKANELKEFKWDVDEYINKGRENAINQEWMKELENASARVHISRLEEIQLQIRQALEVAIASQLGETEGVLEEVYESSYYHSAYELQKGFGVGVDMNKLDPKKVENILNKPWAPDEKTFSDRIWDNKTKLINTIHQELTQNLLLGQDPQRAIDAIAKTMNTSKYNAGRLVMTEEAYFSSVAQKDAFKELDVEKYEIVATLDSHTSDICRHMDGKVYDMKEYEAGVTAPPFHVFCRSTTVPYFDDDFGVIGERAARDEDGKTYNVPADMTYEEWIDRFVESSTLQDIREPVEIEFDTAVEGVRLIQGGYSTYSNGQKYGQEQITITINRQNVAEWEDLPSETKDYLKHSPMSNKPFRLQKGNYEVQRYVEGSIENMERDDIANSLGGEYLGFSFQRRNNTSLYIDFYKKGDELLYSVGKADLKRTVSDSEIEKIEKVALDRERQIIENIGTNHTDNLTKREGDSWITAMKEFHRSIGADGKPTIISDSEYDELPTVLYRGIAPASRMRKDITIKSTAEEMADEFVKSDSPFPSRGIYGDGIAYVSPEYEKIAKKYATDSGRQPHGGVIIEMKLKSDARIINYEDALEVFKKICTRGNSKLLFKYKQTHAEGREVGKAMNALGYDAIIKHDGDHTGFDFYSILNRGALVVKKQYIKTLF